MNDDRRKHSRGSADRRRKTNRNLPIRAYAFAALILMLLGAGLLSFIDL